MAGCWLARFTSSSSSRHRSGDDWCRRRGKFFRQRGRRSWRMSISDCHRTEIHLTEFSSSPTFSLSLFYPHCKSLPYSYFINPCLSFFPVFKNFWTAAILLLSSFHLLYFLCS